MTGFLLREVPSHVARRGSPRHLQIDLDLNAQGLIINGLAVKRFELAAIVATPGFELTYHDYCHGLTVVTIGPPWISLADESDKKARW